MPKSLQRKRSLEPVRVCVLYGEGDNLVAFGHRWRLLFWTKFSSRMIPSPGPPRTATDPLNFPLRVGQLLQSAAETLQEVAANPRHLGGRIGGLMVLHTWGQNLMHHPHVHCVVPAGAISPEGKRWIPSRQDFFLPVRVLSRVFRGKFIAGLKQLYTQGRLVLSGQLTVLSDESAFEQFLNLTVRHSLPGAALSHRRLHPSMIRRPFFLTAVRNRQPDTS